MSLKPMFRRVAKNYDMLNRMLTWTLDKAWRETCAKRCTSSDVIVDLCCGTGELSLHISKHVAITSHVVGLDFSKAMLERAINKEHKDYWTTFHKELLNLMVIFSSLLMVHFHSS